MSQQESEPESDEPDAGMVSCRIDTDRLETIYKALRTAGPEAVLEFTPDGLTAHSVDPVDVMMAEVDVPAEAFEHYDAGGLRVGIEVQKYLDLTTAGDTTHIEWDDEWHRFKVTSGAITTELSTIDPDSVKLQKPSEDVFTETTARFSCEWRDVQTAIKVTEAIHGKAAELSVEADGFIGMRKRGDTDTAEAMFETAMDIERPPDDEHVLLSGGYLKELNAPLSADTEVRMMARNDWPVTVKAEVDGVACTFVLAPRITAE